MEVTSKATRIRLFSIGTPQMRAFHMSWFAFFLCFFAWFGIAPLMKIVRDEMALTQSQIGWLVIGSVAITVVARLLIGWLCDRIGPRRAYTWLLIVGSLPVMGIGLAQDFQTFLVFRLLIGIIGASFVITQYHTSVMFAPNVVGTANATTAGWGNLGGGVTQLVMPIVLGILTVGAYIPFTNIQFLPGLGLSDAAGWRAAMVIAGAMCAVVGVAYWFLTQDAPEGELPGAARGRQAAAQAEREGLVRQGGAGPAGLGALRHLRRVLRDRADRQQRSRPLLHRLLRFLRVDDRGAGGPVGGARRRCSSA